MQRRGRLYGLLAPFDAGMRRVLKSWFASLFRDPAALFRRIHFQSVMIIQPADILPDGSVDMCDGCPDITVWDDRLVWSCRMEEQLRWGQNVRMVPKAVAGQMSDAEPA
jgi:hypothetical protein